MSDFYYNLERASFYAMCYYFYFNPSLDDILSSLDYKKELTSISLKGGLYNG